MKKIILSAAAVFAFGFMNAQEVEFGAKAGLNMASINTSASFGDTKALVGFHIGGVAEIKFTDKISLQPELLYSQEGGKYEFSGAIDGDAIMYAQEIKLSKINLPILFKYYVIENLSIEAGPQLDFVLSAKSESKVDVPANFVKVTSNTDLSNSSSTVTSFDSSDGYTFSDVFYQDYGLKKLNFGFNLGAGYKLTNGMFFQARYTLGLTNFVENGNFLAGRDIAGDKLVDTGNPVEDYKYDNTSFKSSNFQFSVGYKF